MLYKCFVFAENPLKAEICLYKLRDQSSYFQFEIITNVLLGSSCFIRPPPPPYAMEQRYVEL